ncbi:hypothetical protein FE697_021370 [Mumia zhuanghuii]|uniref:Uncharacterized protein n=2 Tax=Mumia TaxID=1546255 RepID=A0ABW1QIL7_9ACTN|nr:MULTISPECIES: hypothetical protein [Mumia]KAA1418372.1 hypothetical protein FE697_021370 [Mumia zhuanghuii]
MSAPYLRDLVADASSDAEPRPTLPTRIEAFAERATQAPDHADVLGPLVVPDTDLPSVAANLPEGAPPLDIAIGVTGGAGAIEPAVRWASRVEGVRVVGLVTAVRDLDDLARGAHRVATMVSQLDADGLLEDVAVQVALPLYARAAGVQRWQHALDTLAIEDLGLLLRTGGGDSDDVPSPELLAGAISDALDREVRFGCVGDLAHAISWRAPSSDRLRYGFLDVLLATRASLDGDDVPTVAERLSRTSAEDVMAELASAGEPALESARRWFTGFGSEDVGTTLADLTALGLLPPRP